MAEYSRSLAARFSRKIDQKIGKRLENDKEEPQTGTALQYQSNALWPDTVSVSRWKDCNVSTDKHQTYLQAQAVCSALEREGFGGQRKVFPIKTWVSPIQDPPIIPDGE